MQSEDGVRVRQSPVFKLKDKHGKNFQKINLKDFGFVPEILIIERVQGSWFRFNAVLTDEEVKKQIALEKKAKRQEKKK